MRDTTFNYSLTETSFKQRFRNHTKSFNYRQFQSETELSKYIWTLTHQNKPQQSSGK